MIFLILLVLNIWLIARGGREKRLSKFDDIGDRTRTLAIVLFVFDVLGVGILVLLICLFDPRWQTVLLCCLSGLLVLWVLFHLLFHKFNKARGTITTVAVVALAFGIVGFTMYDDYLRRISMPEDFNCYTYRPFAEDSLVKTLDEPATLRFSKGDDLPRMDGATALYPVYAAFCQAVYPSSAAKDGLYKIITCSTTSYAYESIVDGSCDIIFVAGPSKEQEAYAAQKGVELVYTPIGREAFVFFVHPKNPVDGLSLEQIRSIYSGETTRWNQLGARGLGRILAYQRDEGSGSQTALERFVMGDTPLMTPKKEQILDAMGGMVEQVSSYKNQRNAIGYSFRFYCTALMKDFNVKLLKIDGVAPTLENIENGSYPLASSFYAVTRSDADENTLALLEWITGPQGQALVEKTGYTPITPPESP